MTSLAALATRNFTTVLALILMASPVWGLRPMRALRSAFTRRPMPGNHEHAVLLGFLDGGLRQQVHERGGLLVGDFEFLGHVPRQGRLGHSSCHVVLLLALPVGAADVLPGSPPSRSNVHGAVPHGVFDFRQRLYENPVFMRVPENPVDVHNAAYTPGKSTKKQPISTGFAGFCGNSAYKSPVLA